MQFGLSNYTLKGLAQKMILFNNSSCTTLGSSLIYHFPSIIAIPKIKFKLLRITSLKYLTIYTISIKISKQEVSKTPQTGEEQKLSTYL